MGDHQSHIDEIGTKAAGYVVALTPRSVNGKSKSQIGNQLLKPVWKKRSPVCFHGATAEPHQLKPKSKLSDNGSEPKLKPGSTKWPKDSLIKSLLLQPESPKVSTVGES